MIASFRHKGLKLLFEKHDRSKIRADVVDKVERILTILNQAEEPKDMDIPGFALHPLKGDLQGYWSVAVSRNHRIIFRFAGGDVHDVEMIDYH